MESDLCNRYYYLEKTVDKVARPWLPMDCSSVSCRNGGRPKYTHVRHKFGAHPGPHYPMCLSVRFRHCSESEKTRQRTGNGTKFKMSAEEDTELRDMVAQTLESKGVLGKIRVWKCTISIKCYVISKLWQSEYIFNSICHAILCRTYGANIPLQLTMTNFCL